MKKTAKTKGKGWKTLWVWVVLAFALLVGAWAALITIASKNAPTAVPIEGKSDVL